MKDEKGLLGLYPDENLSPEDLFRNKYIGIRRPGYPACPDHTEKRVLFDILDAEAYTGVKLTENYAMDPPASVCGYVFAHPLLVFQYRKIAGDHWRIMQQERILDVDEAARWLALIYEFNK
jgi:5-methyltetrahydrofolate--homocysteine methyltransferase